MPSAAAVKLDKQIPETALADPSPNSIQQNNSPIRQAIVILEHKIRNLEKRKSKLESYRELQNSGKDLNQDQKIAVAKYDEVVQTLEFARDLCKQFVVIANVSEKEAKKQARREAAVKNQQELAKLREVLLVQDALTQMGQDTVREDFLLGRNGAATLTENDLKLLDDLYPEVAPKHEQGNPEAFTNQVQSAAEHLLAVVDGKPKEVVGSTYTYIKEVIGKIHESGYFDQTNLETPANVYYGEETVAAGEAQVVIEEQAEVQPIYQQETQQQQQQLPVEQPQQSYYQQPQPQGVQAPPQVQSVPPPVAQRPISEVLGTGCFFFLQDSELDTPPEPPQMISTISTQTFTNQNYVQPPPQPQMVQPGAAAAFGAPTAANPPPPIPMPPSCIQQGGQLEYSNPPQGQMMFQYQPEMNQPQQQDGMRNGGGAASLAVGIVDERSNSINHTPNTSSSTTVDRSRPPRDNTMVVTNDAVDDYGTSSGSPRTGVSAMQPQQTHRSGNPSQQKQYGRDNNLSQQQQQRRNPQGQQGGYQPFYQNNNGYGGGNNRSTGNRGHQQARGGPGGQRGTNNGNNAGPRSSMPHHRDNKTSSGHRQQMQQH